ncbi:E3 ubiquitin-protein ligase CIP8 [Rhododendron vialii]|uniref:E3 ubiquitin-protein ligase CIP8 n=1 Tax=Rhododendron vialii TaxID=182163 RepID=UPI00265E90CA|nr:E3 ubiquitin-protein ligase CIP8 [Rhododendron vialii]XP_058194708.1 E3 ubiquitin-protein ligase CIP8 [Rhododendron vialii]
MAEVTFLHPHDGDGDDSDLIDFFAPVPYYQDFSDTFAPFHPDPFDFNPDAIPAVDLFDRENQVNFVMDLFHQRVEQSGVVSPDPGPTRLELDLGLGFDDDCDEGDFGFRVGVRVGSDSEEDDENEFLGMGLNLEDNNDNNNGCDDDISLQLCWDSFQLEDNNRDGVEDFEWEEVDARVDEREVLSMFDVDEELDVSPVPSVMIPNQDEEEEMGVELAGAMRGNNLEWEVLLDVHNLEAHLSLEHDGVENLEYLGDHDAVEYEMLFGQFAENENSMIGRPPASKTVVENLESVVVTKEDVESDNSLCAVCKDGMTVGEKAKQLPCSHRYHGDCIVPWLGIRNTCPVCRYELPTDDPDYERRKRTQRAGRSH